MTCNVGDVVYFVINNKIFVKEIIYYKKISSRLIEENEEYYLLGDKNRITINKITFYPEDIGKTVFFTKEEAEAKLKELNENDS